MFSTGSMYILKAKSALGLATLAMLAMIAFQTGCRNKYMVTDERGKLVAPSSDPCLFKSSEFERSLCEVYADPFDFQRARLCLMRELLEEFARRDGPASAPAELLQELDSLHVGRDSLRVERSLRRGLADMDIHWESDTAAGAFDRAIQARVGCALKYHTYRPDHEEHFDELGMLIVLKGPFTLERFEELQMTVSFPDGTFYHVVEPTTRDGMPTDNEHKVKLVTTSLGEMSRLQPRDDGQLYTAGGHSGQGGTAAGVDALNDQGRSDKLHAENRRKVDIYAEYLPLQLADISLHVIPAPVGDGLWNGRAGAERGQLWNSRRLLVDCFLNVDRVLSEHSPGDTLAVVVVYEVLFGERQVFVDSLTFVTALPEPGAGVRFRLATRPIECGTDEDWGEYTLKVRLAGGEQQSVRSLPFELTPSVYELIALEPGSSDAGGIPTCMRSAEGKPGGSVELLAPLVAMQFNDSLRAYSAHMDLYLIPEGELQKGKVTVGSVRKFVEGEMLEGDSGSKGESPYLIRSTDLGVPSTNTYLMLSMPLPREYVNGRRIRYGNYTLAGVVTVDGRHHSELRLDRIKLQ